MDASPFDLREFFRAVEESGARALLIGRQAIIALGIPVVTADYDYWIHIDDIARFNAAVEPFGLSPNRAPEAARAQGRYVLENSERVDVLIARVVPTVDGRPVSFDDLWTRRQVVDTQLGARIAIPTIEDLILTKRFGARAKDAEDIRLLEMLRSR